MTEPLPTQAASHPPDQLSPVLIIDVALERTTHVQPTSNVLRIAGMFGLGVDDERTMTILPPTSLSIEAGSLTFITGPSGGGKSSLLRAIAKAAAEQPDVDVTKFHALAELPDQPLVDSFCAMSPAIDPDERLADALRWLNLAALSDAFVWLRRPCELSDGQRYRAAIAHAMALIEQSSSRRLHLLLADEFGAALDRVTAKIFSRQLRKWIDRSTKAVAVIVATTHDDLLESLRPDTLIEKPAGDSLHIHQRVSP